MSFFGQPRNVGAFRSSKDKTKEIRLCDPAAADVGILSSSCDSEEVCVAVMNHGGIGLCVSQKKNEKPMRSLQGEDTPFNVLGAVAANNYYCASSDDDDGYSTMVPGLAIVHP